MKKILTSLGVAAQIGISLSPINAATPKKMNVLFIAIDDLKPELGCYGNTMIKTPNIDKIASNGTTFMSNYCQQAISGATRASLLTGKRPDYTKIWGMNSNIRDMNPYITTLPQYFWAQGYLTAAIGKVFDPRIVDNGHDKPSWSVPYYDNSDSYFSVSTGMPVLGAYQSPETKALFAKYTQEAKNKGLSGSALNNYVRDSTGRPSVECVDVPDNAYGDGAKVYHAKYILDSISKDSKPFFFAIGISKPHLAFNAPKKYWDLYNREDMPVAIIQDHAKNSPDFAYHNSNELRNYSDIPPLTSFSDQTNDIGLPIWKQQELIHGYYAAVSYADALVGEIMHTLDSLNLTNNTIVVLWGDHGWHLGDHDLWCKHSNFENAARAPMIISVPGMQPNKTSSLTEFVDIFPTLCDLTGIPVPGNLDGETLVPIMINPEIKMKNYAVSQYPHADNRETMMGYSFRNEQYRYTVWMGDNFRSTSAYNKDLVRARELYDYINDPLETVNVVDSLPYKSIVTDMDARMVDYFKNANLVYTYSQTTLNADAPGRTYELIDSAFVGGGNAIDHPDCVHTSFGRHITEVFDNVLNTSVFEFNIHVTPDNDRCINTDRQGVEIKPTETSPETLKGKSGETVTYKWKFLVPTGFQPSASFTHFHQINTVGGSNSAPLFTLSASKGLSNKMEVNYNAIKLIDTDLSLFEGNWVEATEIIKIDSVHGSYSLSINKVSDGTSILTYTNPDISTIRTDNSYVVPSWGIYRSLSDVVSLRDESIRYNNFSISEKTEAHFVSISGTTTSGNGKIFFFKEGQKVTDQTQLLKGDSVIVFAVPNENEILTSATEGTTIHTASPFTVIIPDSNTHITANFEKKTILFKEGFGRATQAITPVAGTGAYTGYENPTSVATFSTISGNASNTKIHNKILTNDPTNTDLESTNLYVQNSNFKITFVEPLIGSNLQMKFKILPINNPLNTAQRFFGFNYLTIKVNSTSSTPVIYAPNTVMSFYFNDTNLPTNEFNTGIVNVGDAPYVVVPIPPTYTSINTIYINMNNPPDNTLCVNRCQMDDILFVGDGIPLYNYTTDIKDTKIKRNIFAISNETGIELHGNMLLGSLVSIYGMLSGNPLITRTIGSDSEFISTRKLPAGVYIVSLQDDQGEYHNIKVVVNP